MIFELCTDSVAGALEAEKYGLKRIELCSALSVGGLTPSFGLIKQCVEKTNVEVHVMIRHKEGDFQYNSDDVKLMKIDINAAKKAGAKGVVFGILTKNHQISDLNMELAIFSKSLNLEITFHRAFDFVKDENLAIEKIISFGFDRLLTSGLQKTAIQGVELIKKLQFNYGDLIQIMAGSGINEQNALEIANSKINNLHFTARKFSKSETKLSMGNQMIIDTNKIRSIVNLF